MRGKIAAWVFDNIPLPGWASPWVFGLIIGRRPHERAAAQDAPSMVDERDKRDWQLFKLPNEKGKFAIQIGYPDEVIEKALERAMDNDWVQLIDVELIAHGRGTVCRVFKLTPEGRARRDVLKTKFPAAFP